MKFTDGYWQVLPGVSILRPGSVDEVVAEDTSDGARLTVFAPTARIESRGDTLNRPQVTVTLDTRPTMSSGCGSSTSRACSTVARPST